MTNPIWCAIGRVRSESQFVAAMMSRLLGPRIPDHSDVYLASLKESWRPWNQQNEYRRIEVIFDCGQEWSKCYEQLDNVADWRVTKIDRSVIVNQLRASGWPALKLAEGDFVPSVSEEGIYAVNALLAVLRRIERDSPEWLRRLDELIHAAKTRLNSLIDVLPQNRLDEWTRTFRHVANRLESGNVGNALMAYHDLMRGKYGVARELFRSTIRRLGREESTRLRQRLMRVRCSMATLRWYRFHGVEP